MAFLSAPALDRGAPVIDIERCDDRLCLSGAWYRPLDSRIASVILATLPEW